MRSITESGRSETVKQNYVVNLMKKVSTLVLREKLLREREERDDEETKREERRLSLHYCLCLSERTLNRSWGNQILGNDGGRWCRCCYLVLPSPTVLFYNIARLSASWTLDAKTMEGEEREGERKKLFFNICKPSHSISEYKRLTCVSDPTAPWSSLVNRFCQIILVSADKSWLNLVDGMWRIVTSYCSLQSLFTCLSRWPSDLSVRLYCTTLQSLSYVLILYHWSEP